MALTVSQIEKALRAKGGFVTQTAKALGVTASAIYYRIEKSSQLQKVKKEIDESFLDLTESKLVKLINEENLGAICFYLKCKGKSRGYVEKPIEKAIEIQPEISPQTIKIVMEDARRDINKSQ